MDVKSNHPLKPTNHVSHCNKVAHEIQAADFLRKQRVCLHFALMNGLQTPDDDPPTRHRHPSSYQLFVRTGMKDFDLSRFIVGSLQRNILKGDVRSGKCNIEHFEVN
jgi:hypothetical protein